MVTPLEAVFPSLVRSGYRITSSSDRDYNCIAWAAGDTRQWWWPGPNIEDEYWPPGLVREETLETFRLALTTLGYEVCRSEDLEPGLEKIALFGDAQGKPTHAARQLASGRWTSKLGEAEDIEHALRDLEGEVYGHVVLVMRRLGPTGSGSG